MRRIAGNSHAVPPVIPSPGERRAIRHNVKLLLVSQMMFVFQMTHSITRAATSARALYSECDSLEHLPTFQELIKMTSSA